MNILICDDEPLIAARVEQKTTEFFNDLRLPVNCTVCSSGEETLERDDLADYQVALLDVELEGMNGIALGHALHERNPELVLVYISAYLNFAIDGYTVHAFRYILKHDLDKMLPRCLSDILDSRTKGGLSFQVHQGRDVIEVPLIQIYCFESDRRKVHVYGDIKDKPMYTYNGKLADLPKELFENGFLRIGRSHVVNMRYIRTMTYKNITLRNGQELVASRANYAEIRAAYLEWKGQFGDE